MSSASFHLGVQEGAPPAASDARGEAMRVRFFWSLAQSAKTCSTKRIVMGMNAYFGW